MSSTWRDEPDQRETRVAKRRLRRRASARGGSLALPAVVLSTLGVAFLVWFLIGAPLNGGTPGQAAATTPIRAPVQPPQIAAAPVLVDAKTADPAPAREAAPSVDPVPQMATGILPLALQSTRQISTPATMMPVVSAPEQMMAPGLAAPSTPERRQPSPPDAPPVTQATAAPAPSPRPAPRQEVKPEAKPEARIEVKAEIKPTSQPVAAAEAPAVEADKAARNGFTVVLASVETEGEARSKLGQFKQKFAGQLGGRRLNYHRTKQDGAIVWHVRTAGMSEADAETLCEQIEKAGGDCAPIAQ